LQEYEIRFLCTKAREIFINQPILLELEAPIKICGMAHQWPQGEQTVAETTVRLTQETFTANTTIFSAYLNMVVSRQKRITSSLVTM
jgi:hypothetical protein